LLPQTGLSAFGIVHINGRGCAVAAPFDPAAKGAT
jgi:hypothetical protein